MDEKKLGNTLYERIVERAKGDYDLNLDDRDVLTINFSSDEVSKLLVQPSDLFVDEKGQ